jgi:pseudouridine synthase
MTHSLHNFKESSRKISNKEQDPTVFNRNVQSPISITSANNRKPKTENAGTRINKCLPSLSRRHADAAVAEGRVSVNGKVVNSLGHRVQWNDIVKLDGKKQNWQSVASAMLSNPATEFDEQQFLYLKYWKPVGVTCTSDPKDPSNIITQGKFSILPQRVFTVGRLDRESSGLILLTSDGRVNSAFLHRSQSKEKVYEVTTDKTLSEYEIQSLRQGIMISTPIQRESYKSNDYTRFVTAKTLPCQVVRLNNNKLRMTLIEGRNRQIRRMMDSLGVKVVELKRISFAGITLQGLSEPGKWKELSNKEMRLIQSAISFSYELRTKDSNEEWSADE